MSNLFSLSVGLGFWVNEFPIAYASEEDLYVSLFLKIVNVNYSSQASPRCANLALKHYLLKPVQRIPQYQLLLTGTSKEEYPQHYIYSP